MIIARPDLAMDIRSYMAAFQPYLAAFEFNTDLERLGIDSWLAADPMLPLTHTVGVTDWLDATKDMGVTPIRDVMCGWLL